jgi:XTP/dITP diphosphohydrolase
VTVVLATRNPHKIVEIREALDVPGVEFRGLDAFPDAPEVVEDGDTFEENAAKKARAAAAATGFPSLADDSGLVVDALNGDPGVRSARFAGPAADDAANRDLLLERLLGVEVSSRSARFVCVLALATPDGEVETCEGRCDGVIAEAERGREGFGYDPLFVPDGESRTFAQMSRAEKARLSHRGRALQAARPMLLGVRARSG